VCYNLTKGQVKKSSQHSVKHIHGRLQLLQKVLEMYPINKHNISYQSCLDYALLGFQHQNGDVRNTAYHIILLIYKAVGG